MDRPEAFDPSGLWLYLSESPLLWLTVTLGAFQLATWLFRRGGSTPLLNPVLVSGGLVIGVLWLTGTDYATYFEGARFVHFLLGPATVALAVPVYNQLATVKRSAVALLTAIVCGGLAAAGSAVGIAWALGAGVETMLSLAPKSVTAPIAMGVARELGGLPSLTAALVILTGIVGAIAGTWVLKLVGVTDDRARGVAIGTASHGIGTARAFQVSETAGAFSGLAMGLNGLATAVLLPLLYVLLFG